MEGKLAPGEFKTYPIVITWHFPNCYLEQGGKPATDVEGKRGCHTRAEGLPPLWRPYYAGVWKDAREVALYVEQECVSLRERTAKFKEALFSSTVCCASLLLLPDDIKKLADLTDLGLPDLAGPHHLRAPEHRLYGEGHVLLADIGRARQGHHLGGDADGASTPIIRTSQL